ncbi:hypothetical protein [Horticoccus sp. 23ND18S-11]|uniref:hypothetical protein n=1 Tax=Horticoccus sp. 23ND18S-11 TaxID=3391832 RepID=UPI0039C984C3
MRFLAALHVFSCVATLSAVSARAAEPAAVDIGRELVRQNDAQVAGWLDVLPARAAQPREAARLLKLAVAAHAHAESRFHHQAPLLALIERLARTLQERQNADGSFDAEFAGGNPQSPPDSAFALRHIAQAQALLDADRFPAAANARDRVRTVLDRGALILRTGGVHTPNHRWVICGALSHLQTVRPAAENIARIDAWLGEGVDQDRDGQFSERSTIYSGVTVEALLDLAVSLQRPALLEPVRRHLEFLLFQADANGELDTLASRRQDQQLREPRRLAAYYVPLRLLAIRLNDGRFAAAARAVERDDRARITDHVAEWMQWPELRQPLPASQPLPEDFAHHFPASGLARIRRGPVSASVFGGGDWAAIRDISSGLSTNPTFFRFRKGAAVLESVRLAPAFFNLGYFRSDGLEVAADGREYRLAQTQRAAYYQPLPPEHRRADGDYALTNDGRFYSKMDFPHRPRDEKQLTSRVTVRERPEGKGAFELEFVIDGTAGIGVTIELCFRAGGVLTGTAPRDTEPDTAWLKSGYGRYTVGADAIEFGPGLFGPSRFSLAGEAYSWRNGQVRTEGVRVYLTGVTPFRHTLVIR